MVEFADTLNGYHFVRVYDLAAHVLLTRLSDSNQLRSIGTAKWPVVLSGTVRFCCHVLTR